MRRCPLYWFMAISLLLTFPLAAQDKESDVVPHLVRYQGQLERPAGDIRVVGIRFAIYKEKEGGAPLWQEVQNVTLDAEGRYSVLLGSATAGDLPRELFAQNESRWLAVEVEGEATQPRTLLVSVPYALKAGDAETLGGRPASAYLLAPDRTRGPKIASAETASEENPQTTVETTTGTTNSVAKFLDNLGTIGNSLLFDNGTNVGIGTISPANKFHILTTNNFQMAGFESSTNSNAGISIRNSVQNWIVGVRSDISQAFNIRSSTTATNGLLISPSGNVGIGMTTAPTRKLQVVGFGDLQLASFESAVNGNVGFGFKTPSQNWGVGNRGDLTNAFAIRNITGAFDALVINTNGNVNFGANSLLTVGSGGIKFSDNSTQTTAAITQSAADIRYLLLSGGAISGNSSGAVVQMQQAGTFVGEPSLITPPASALQASATNTTGVNTGVLGISSSPDGFGLIGVNASEPPAPAGANPGESPQTEVDEDEGAGVLGISFTAGIPGVMGESDASEGDAIGVKGQSQSPSGYGVFGVNTAEAGPGIAVRAESMAQDGIGVSGFAFGEGVTTGVVGRVFSAEGTAGRFVSDNAAATLIKGAVSGTTKFEVAGSGETFIGGTLVVDGPDGETTQILQNMAVQGSLTVNGANSQFNGAMGAQSAVFTNNVSVGGTLGANQLNSSGLNVTSGTIGTLAVTTSLSKPAGSFKIDHPLDPLNKVLYHSFVESPDMKNVYDGVAVLDARGEAWVELPNWFDALNRDFRYQLTAMGKPMPSLYIAQEMQGNRFKISGGKSGAKVSWQVTGIRQDQFAETHRIPVEEDKPADQRGKYLYPAAYDQHVAQKNK